MKPQSKLSHLLDIKHLVKPFSSFVHEMYSPSQNKLGTVILGVMVAAQTLISIFWINVFSGLGDGYAFMVIFPYAYIVLSYASLLLFYRLKRTSYFTFTQLAMLLVMPFFHAMDHRRFCRIQQYRHLGYLIAGGSIATTGNTSVHRLVRAVLRVDHRIVVPE